MTCRDIELLLLTERDGALTSEQRAALGQHVATCPACQQLRARLNAALNTFQADAANVAVPDIETEWRTLRAQLHGGQSKPEKKRPLAPVIWFGSAMAAAAALTLAYLGQQPKQTEPVAAPAIAQVKAAGDTNASTMVYVDQESGWLVVWATDADTGSQG
jgi:anti-sigma factor RsiW